MTDAQLDALLPDVIRALEARGVKREGAEQKFRCFYPEKHAHGDRDWSGSFNPAKKVWCCPVCDVSGGLLDLADRLGVRRPQQEGMRPPRLEDFAESRCLTLETLRRFGVRPVIEYGRSALRYSTAVRIDRLKFVDGQKPKYCWASKGGHRHWYGLREALALLRAGASTLYMGNGEPSVWAGTQAGVAVVSPCGGERAIPTAAMVEELVDALRALGRPIPVRIIYDTDKAGRRGALENVLPPLAAVELDVQALDLAAAIPDVAGADVDDLHRRVGDAGLAAALAGLPVLTLRDGADDGAAPPGDGNRGAGEANTGGGAAQFEDDEAARFAAGGGAHAGAAPPWPALHPLPDDSLPPVPTLPPTLLPAALHPWLVDAAERLDVPLELVATPALVMLGGLIGRRLGLRPKRYDDWVVVPNVWGAIITRPGFLKSPAMHEAKRHLDRLAAAATEAHETRAAAVEIERVIVETEIAKLKRDATGKGGDPEAIRTKLAELQQRLSAAVAVPTRFYTNDSTVEKLGVLLNENPGGLLLVRDELAGWLRTLEKPGREGDREFFLEAWNGIGPYDVDRIGRGTLHILALTVAICGTMQPGKLQAYVAEALDSDGSGADGLLQRFQLLVWPDFNRKWRNVDRPPDVAARERAWRVFEAVATFRGAAEIPTVRFAPDAQELFGDWRQKLEGRLRSDEFSDCPAYESHVAKYRSLMPALALILHVAETAGGASVSFVSASVGLGAARTAAALVDFFDVHARRVYAPELGRLTSPQAALAERLRTGSVRDGDKVRDIYRRQWAGLRTRELVESAIADLMPLGWVRLEERQTGGRRDRVLRVHPALRMGGDGNE
jgi:putative DNA primase/helicase